MFGFSLVLNLCHSFTKYIQATGFTDDVHKTDVKTNCKASLNSQPLKSDLVAMNGGCQHVNIVIAVRDCDSGLSLIRMMRVQWLRRHRSQEEDMWRGAWHRSQHGNNVTQGVTQSVTPHHMMGAQLLIALRKEFWPSFQHEWWLNVRFPCL